MDRSNWIFGAKKVWDKEDAKAIGCRILAPGSHKHFWVRALLKFYSWQGTERVSGACFLLPFHTHSHFFFPFYSKSPIICSPPHSDEDDHVVLSSCMIPRPLRTMSCHESICSCRLSFCGTNSEGAGNDSTR